MVKSMTAFGRSKTVSEGRNITAEIKSVNGRYFDCTVKLPRNLSYLEEKVKAYLQSHGVTRGKVDVYIGVEVTETEGIEIALDSAYAKGYIEALRRLRDEFSLADDISVMSVAQNHDIFNVKKPEEDAEAEWQMIKSPLDDALNGFIERREAEGARIEDDLRAKMKNISGMVDEVEKLSANDTETHYEKLEERIKKLLGENNIVLDEGRLLTECAIYADKIAIDEELVRLRSHFVTFEEMLASPEAVGRKLDFLIQEINRETNTIGSKAANVAVARVVVAVKSELEKIREQIQNIE